MITEEESYNAVWINLQDAQKCQCNRSSGTTVLGLHEDAGIVNIVKLLPMEIFMRVGDHEELSIAVKQRSRF
jgi:hypothetical protein